MANTPKNIRQIGAREERVKVYLEDYVSTYLRKIQRLQEETGVAGWLVGEWQKETGMPDNLFVSGAMEVEETGIREGSPTFGEGAWNQGYEILGTYFPGQSLCGIFVCEGSCRRLRRQALFAMVRQCFGQQSALLYLLTEDGEEVVYRIHPGSEERLQGYYCYFERNEAMQDYMMEHLPERRVEWEMSHTMRSPEPMRGKEGAFEDPAQGGKQRLRRRKEGSQQAARSQLARPQIAQFQTSQPRGTQSGSSGVAVLCAVMAVVIFVSGLGLVYRQRGGIPMQAVLDRLGIDPQALLAVSARPEETGEHYVGRETTSGSQEGMGVIVEEIPGQVYPTEEESQETTSTEASTEVSTEAATEASNEVSTEVSTEASAESSTEAATEVSAEESSEEEWSLPAGAGVVYVVQAGDSLYSISRRFYGTDEMVKVIQQLNELTDPDRIQVGQELLLP